MSNPCIFVQFGPSSQRIIENVVGFFYQFGFVSNNSIKVLALPDCCTSPEKPLQAIGCKRFPGMDDFL